jgi:predicted dehydrogenase
MNSPNQSTNKPTSTRRDFLVRSAALSAGLAGGLSVARSAHAAGGEELKIALVGCGGRGTGAARDCLSSEGPIKLVAMADVYEDRLQTSLKGLRSVEPIADRIDVPEERQFIGFDAYQKVLAMDIDIVLLCTPPAFRPLQYTAAIAAGKNVFMEKPCCVDGPGFRKVMAANKIADDKGLKVVVGLQRRHQASYLEGMKRVHDGEFGDLIMIRTYFNMPAGGHSDAGKPDSFSELEWQIRRWNFFTWLSGDHIVEQAVHEIDIANWMKKDEPPVRANGLGGRQSRTGRGNGQIFDHHFVEYIWEDGSRHFAQAKQQPGGWSHVSDNVHGTKGMVTVGSGPYGLGGPMDNSSGADRADRKKTGPSPYLVEHQDLVDAIRQNKPLNDGYHGAKSSMTAAMGRMVTYSGDEITWEQATQSTLELAPGLDQMTLASAAPVQPDAEGNYPIAKPGISKAY